MQAGTVENFVCSFIVKIGVKALPAFSILVGEATMSYMLGHVVILPSPIGVELMEFPAKMMYALKKKAGIKVVNGQPNCIARCR